MASSVRRVIIIERIAGIAKALGETVDEAFLCDPSDMIMDMVEQLYLQHE